MGEKNAEGVREAGVAGLGRGSRGAGGGSRGAGSGILKVAGSGRNRGKLRNIAQYFAIEIARRGVSQRK